MGRERRSWTDEEDDLLRAAVQQEDPDSRPPTKWHAISEHVPNRTNKDCRKRWFAKMASVVTKGGWSAEEDDKLLKGVQRFGTKWSLVASMVESRNNDQCAKRWTDTLNPDIDRTTWSPAEDAHLLEAVKQHGKSWKLIVKTHFPGRTGLSAKNRYSRLVRISLDGAHSNRTRRKSAAPSPYSGRQKSATPASIYSDGSSDFSAISQSPCPLFSDSASAAHSSMSPFTLASPASPSFDSKDIFDDLPSSSGSQVTGSHSHSQPLTSPSSATLQVPASPDCPLLESIMNELSSNFAADADAAGCGYVPQSFAADMPFCTSGFMDNDLFDDADPFTMSTDLPQCYGSGFTLFPPDFSATQGMVPDQHTTTTTSDFANFPVLSQDHMRLPDEDASATTRTTMDFSPSNRHTPSASSFATAVTSQLLHPMRQVEVSQGASSSPQHYDVVPIGANEPEHNRDPEHASNPDSYSNPVGTDMFTWGTDLDRRVAVAVAVAMCDPQDLRSTVQTLVHGLWGSLNSGGNQQTRTRQSLGSLSYQGQETLTTSG